MAEANLILDHLPMEIALVSIRTIFSRASNDSVPADEMIFKQAPSQIGHNVRLSPQDFGQGTADFQRSLREESGTSLRCGSSRIAGASLSMLTYAAVRAGEFQSAGYVQDIQPAS